MTNVLFNVFCLYCLVVIWFIIAVREVKLLVVVYRTHPIIEKTAIKSSLVKEYTSYLVMMRNVNQSREELGLHRLPVMEASYMYKHHVKLY
jgi:hypothetical protein